MTLLFILMAAMTAAVAAVVFAGVKNRRLRRAGVVILPVLALALYLPFGRPSDPAYRAVQTVTDADHLSLLAVRPMEILRDDPHHVAALAVMGDISQRLGKNDLAHEFYTRAATAAEMQGDLRAGMYADKAAMIIKRKAVPD